VADVIADGESLNLAMVRNGYAAVYPKYCKDSAYYRAQDSARGAGLGIWSKPGLQQTPWEYRHR
jgi:endonuclease YncB( thermonuclease family)